MGTGIIGFWRIRKGLLQDVKTYHHNASRSIQFDAVKVGRDVKAGIDPIIKVMEKWN